MLTFSEKGFEFSSLLERCCMNAGHFTYIRNGDMTHTNIRCLWPGEPFYSGCSEKILSASGDDLEALFFVLRFELK